MLFEKVEVELAVLIAIILIGRSERVGSDGMVLRKEVLMEDGSMAKILRERSIAFGILGMDELTRRERKGNPRNNSFIWIRCQAFTEVKTHQIQNSDHKIGRSLPNDSDHILLQCHRGFPLTSEDRIIRIIQLVRIDTAPKFDDMHSITSP